MIRPRAYVHLQPATMSPCDITKSCYERARETWLCTGCCVPRPEFQAIDVEIESAEELNGHVLTFVNGCGLGLVHRELLEWLPSCAVSTDLWLGNVCDSEGRTVEEWNTFRGRNRLIVRGSRNVSYRRCGECGRHVYFAMGKRYVFPAPDERVFLFESDLCGIIIPKSVFQQLLAKTWPLVTVETLAVASEPKDSLGMLV